MLTWVPTREYDGEIEITFAAQTEFTIGATVELRDSDNNGIPDVVEDMDFCMPVGTSEVRNQQAILDPGRSETVEGLNEKDVVDIDWNAREGSNGETIVEAEIVVKKESVESSSIPELKWLGDDTFELTIQGNEKELNKTCSREELQKKLEEFLAETFISLDKTSSSEQKEKSFNSSEKYDEGPALEDIYERITGGQNT